MSGQTVPLTIKELQTTYGILFTAYSLAMVLYGFTLFQTYVYFSRYPLDHRVIKMTVACLCIKDTISSVLISHALYYYLVFSFPNSPPLMVVTRTYCAEIGVSILAVLIVQIYYSHRVWVVSQNAAVAVGIAITSLAAFALGMAATGDLAKNLVFSSLTTPQARGIMASSLGLTFLSGVVVFAALTFYAPSLVMESTSWAERLCDDVVVHGISRGSLATTVQLAYLVAFILSSASAKLFWMPFHLTASRIFINSLLTMLNTREVHQGQGVNEDVSRKTASSFTPPVRSNIRFAAVESKPGINVQVSRMANNDTSNGDEEAYDWGNKRGHKTI